MAEALTTARDRHLRLVEEAGLGRPEEGNADVSWRALRRYREGVAREVVGPLLEALLEGSPGTRVTELWEAFLAGQEEATAPLPDVVLRPEPSDLYAPAPSDGLWPRARKAGIRSGRAVTGLFRRDRIRAQEVPLRALAVRSFRSRALPGVVDLAESLQLHYGRSVAALERAVGEWLRDWFPLEDAARIPEGHLEPALSERLGALRTAFRPLMEELGLAPRPEEDAAEAPEVHSQEKATEEVPDPGTPAGPPPPSPARVAASFQERLTALAEIPHAAPVLDEVRRAMEGARTRFARDIHDAGSPLARSLPRGEEKRLDRLRVRLDRREELWTTWHAAAAGRLGLSREVLSLRGDLDGTLDRLMDEVLQASILDLSGRLARGRDGLLELHEEAADPDSPLVSSEGREAVAEAVGDLLETAEELLRARVLATLTPDRMDPPVRAAADRAAEAMAERIRGLPESVEVHAVRETALGLDPEQPTRVVRLQEFVRQSLDVLQLESLRTAVAPLLSAMEEVRSECQEIPRIVEYNLTAARNELREAEAADEGSILADARVLTLQGLERSARTLDQVMAEALPSWDAFADRVHGVVQRALAQSHERLTLERAVQEQFRDIRSLLESQLRRLREQGTALWTATRRTLEHGLRRAYIVGVRVVRRGRMALGADQAQAGEAERAMEVLRGIPALLDPLPLVYRRLFSFQPVTDPSLLVGRDDEAAWLTRRYAAWKEGMRTPSVLTGQVTVGHTSFFNVMAATVFKDARVVRLTFPQRYRTEAGMVERMADEFRRVGAIPGSETPWTLDRLAAVLLERPGGESEGPPEPLVVLTEQIAHLFLRVPGGGLLAERLLEFQARTSDAVFWVTSASDPLWKLLRKTEPRATALVTTGTMTPMGRDELEKLILVRHQRSGVPLEFLAPDDANPLLRRKLQRARNEEERYQLLRGEFFDRLHRASQGNVTMAILLWLKSADFSSKGGWLQLHPPRPIRFSFLDELDADMDFALMAFLEHGSLTLEEYTAIFAARPDDAFQTLEALRGRTLLDRLDAQGSLPETVQHIDDGVRYRVPPILSQVVSTYLRNQNILH